MTKSVLNAFPPVTNSQARILILGSMPGVVSVKHQQYYAHPSNAFWKIMQELFSVKMDAEYSQKIQQLSACGIALWDVAKQCVRQGSMDAAIEDNSIVVNNFEAFFRDFGLIHNVFFNGAKAAQIYQKHVLQKIRLIKPDLQYQQLPSTSPANARMSLRQKIVAWEVVKQALYEE